MAAGLIRRISLAATPKPRPSVSTAAARFSGERPDGVADAMVTTSEAGNPDAMASTRASVASATRIPRARRTWARLSAGNRWPPVPPAQRRIVGGEDRHRITPATVAGAVPGGFWLSIVLRGRLRVRATRKPVPRASEIIDEPPKEMNGRVMPLAGIN